MTGTVAPSPADGPVAIARRTTAMVVADTDSYVKWGAAVLDGLPGGWTADLVVLLSENAPSEAQLATALAGTSRAGRRVRMLRLPDLVAVVAERTPDLVLVATRGPVARVVLHALSLLERRPVLVSGFPGISWPATRQAIDYRAQADLVLLHSHREVESFSQLAEERGVEFRAGLLTFPFLRTAASGTSEVRNEVVFAVQSIVPEALEDRRAVLDMLAEYAKRHPRHRVVLKVRAVGGERQTHDEPYPYTELLVERGESPANLVVEGGPMAEHLQRAVALVTVSSTAILEALAAGVPVHAIGDFGVTKRLINPVFEHSGLMGDRERLLAGDFRPVDPEWARLNYLHPAEDNDWHEHVEDLVEQRRRKGLPVRPRAVPALGGALRLAWERQRALGRHGSTPLGIVALAVGYPLYRAAKLRQRISRRMRRERPDGLAV